MTRRDRAAISEAAWWQRPSRHALTDAECDAILEAAQVPVRVGMQRLRPQHGVDTPGVHRVIDLLEAVNARRWKFPVLYYGPSVRTYGFGVEMKPHRDYDPKYGDDFPACTFAASVQLSDPDEYRGGDLVLDDGRRLPRARGTVGIWTAHTRHRVERITAGQRSALVVFAQGWETIREAHADGWPARW